MHILKIGKSPSRRPTDGVLGRRPAAAAVWLSWPTSSPPPPPPQKWKSLRPCFSRSWPPTRRVAAAPPMTTCIARESVSQSCRIHPVEPYVRCRADAVVAIVCVFSSSVIPITIILNIIFDEEMRRNSNCWIRRTVCRVRDIPNNRYFSRFSSVRCAVDFFPNLINFFHTCFRLKSRRNEV